MHVFKLFADVRARLEPREDCPNVCANNLYDDYYYSYLACDKSTSCLDSCCPTGQTCQGNPETCQPLKPTCIDSDNDGYFSNAVECGKSSSLQDCDDANSAVYPGSCSSAAVSWSACGASTTGGCGSGTCPRALPSGCGDVCGDGSRTGDEGCDAW